MSKNTQLWKILGPGLGSLLLAVAVGCGAGAPKPLSATHPATGEGHPVPAPAAAPSLPDMDKDGVPDAIELAIGTDPHDIDSDHDGLTDHYELWPDLPLNQTGSLANLPDPNGNGIIAPLDPGDMGAKQVLKNASAVLSQQRVPVTQPTGESLPNDLDGDGIPNDFELFGFYYTVDENNVPYFVKWDGHDTSKNYFKTDPTQWSTDGDPFSDWEEATKINLDQRVKSPGDHPCIPAYPQLVLALTSYRIDLNQDVEISSESGGKAESSWTNATETVSNGHTDYNEDGREGEFKVGIALEMAENWIGIPTFSGKLRAEVNGYETSVSKNTTVNSSVTTDDHSGMSAQDWATATTSSSNTSDAARLALHMKVMNIGTLPATDPIILCNLKLGGVAINSLVVNLSEYGEFQAQAGNATDIVVQYDGRASDFAPQGDPLSLSLYQLRTLQTGVPLELEVTGFTANTLVWSLDPNTGRRAFLTMGEWTPYQSAIQNVTANLMLDFRNQAGSAGVNLVSGLPQESTMETKVFCYRPDSNYYGSPPVVLMGDAFRWAFGGVESDIGPVVTIRDPVTRTKFSSPLALWEFSFDKLTIDEILADPERYGNVFNLPLEPSNPGQRVYTCSAPPPSALENPKIYWATCDPASRKIRAFSRDVRGIKEMRFKPDPTADYSGEKMSVGFDPTDVHSQFFYTYELPVGYHWTGNEQVLAVNRADKQTALNVQIEGGQLGFLSGQGLYGLPAGPVSTYSTGLSFGTDITVTPPADITFAETRVGDDLQLQLAPGTGQLVDALFVIDPVDAQGHPLLDAQGNPLHVIDYNFLRKQAYQPTALNETIFATGSNSAPPAHSFCVLSPNGTVSVLHPHLVLDYSAGGVYAWKVDSIEWRSYSGI